MAPWPSRATRRRRRWLRSAVADTRAELAALRGLDDDDLAEVVRTTRGTLDALEDALRDDRGGTVPHDAPPTRAWTPRGAWLARASMRPDLAGTVHAAITRERDARAGS